jgi:FlaA1/EpsC-like NDP-sugar epimerase
VTLILRAAAWNLSATGRGRKQIVSVSADLILAVLSIWAAYSLRLNTPYTNIGAIFHLMMIVGPLSVLVFASLGVYRWVVRSSNMSLYVQLGKSCSISAMILLLTMHLLPTDDVNPRSLFVIFGLVFLASTCTVRLFWRALFDSERLGIPIAIYGAGAAGTQLASLLMNGTDYRPVCFIDDDTRLRDTTILGLRVLLGNRDDLARKLAGFEITQIVVAIPSLDAPGYSRVVSRIQDLGVSFKTLPSIAEMVSGKASLSEIRDITINDIVGRNELVSDPTLLGSCVSDKSVLVAGGGGSIGSELCRQIVLLRPKTLTVIDNCEANLYHVTEQISSILIGEKLELEIDFFPILCSVADKKRIDLIFKHQYFDTVFHAAAYKHVPIVEAHPEQGVEVNVFGTLNLVDSAIRSRTKNFVLISTDKAVRPANVMGKTKRVAELILQAKSKQTHETRISMVRFGNVLDSTGSVVPKFKKQIESGGPVTLTDLRITRYFMTIPEASQLVLQASAIAKGGDVFVLDMGEPVSIRHLAETMINLHRRQIELRGDIVPDIKIEVTGLRPGEKMYEELFIGEGCTSTVVTKVMTADERSLEWRMLSSLLDGLRRQLESSTTAQLIKSLDEIVTTADHGPIQYTCIKSLPASADKQKIVS